LPSRSEDGSQRRSERSERSSSSARETVDGRRSGGYRSRENTGRASKYSRLCFGNDELVGLRMLLSTHRPATNRRPQRQTL
ncbi:MAG TPA: hypothetical protein VKA97_01505, partial [Pyrinomonadaceae bacterium]|nr:hypothetical protein [Pyrinomonadaceae bacterium]